GSVRASVRQAIPQGIKTMGNEVGGALQTSRSREVNGGVTVSQLSEALQVAVALPRLKKEAVERASKAIERLTISDLHLLADAIEQEYVKAGTFQSATGTLAVAIM